MLKQNHLKKGNKLQDKEDLQNKHDPYRTKRLAALRKAVIKMAKSDATLATKNHHHHQLEDGRYERLRSQFDKRVKNPAELEDLKPVYENAYSKSYH